MNIKITKVVNGTWVEGKINDGQYEFIARVYDEGSMFGIEEGRVSFLQIRKGNTSGWYGVFCNYDRGWDIKPEDEEEEISMELWSYLENEYGR
jgi:hypothetical protein